MANVPTNTPRDIQETRDKMRSLMADEPINVPSSPEPQAHSDASVSYDAPDSGPFTHMTSNNARGAAPIQEPRTYKLTLTHELYKVTFMVQDVSVADYQLAIKVPKSDFRFEPQPNSRFLLECMGKSYSVVYLGGLFDFPSDSSWSITFMLDEDQVNYDNTRTPNAHH